ncbi:MAG: TonB family protein, partial [Candidatus Aminicenantes bacterium]
MGAKKILVIDYDQSSLATLQGILAKQGYQIVTAADGQAGWDKYNKESPDLVLMEAMLPKVHGFELCQRITSERNSQATVFIMTGVYKDRVYRTEALRTYGASEYFEKPLKMAELLASIEAVLGKPEPRPAEAQPAAPPAPPRPSREIRAEMSPAEPRKREKPKSDDDIFSLPADLDRLSRELPKPHKPAPAHREAPAEERLDAFADELLKKVIVESTAPKPVEPKPAGGNGNGNGNGNGKAEIDQFLKSALAGFDLDKEKVKSVKAKPVPTPPPPAAPEPKPTPPPARRVETYFPAAAEKDMKNTLVPGDPGSDVSPFFTPEKPKPEAPVEKPRTQAAPAHPARVPSPKPSGPAEKDERPAAPAHAPVRPAPPRHEPAHHETKSREAEAIASADIFGDLSETKEKKGFPKLVAVALVIVALAAVGFVLLRPKPKAPDLQSQQAASQAMTETNTPAEPVNEAPPPEVKPAPVKQKAQPQAKPANPDPAGADAILPTGTAAAAPPLIGTNPGPGTSDGRSASGSNTAPVDPPAAKTESAPPPVAEKAADLSQGAVADDGTAANTLVPAAPEPAPVAAPVKEGDLVELGSVTEPPKIIKSADPVYPQTAHRLGIGGSITVNALIDEKGNVIDTGILKGVQDDKGLGRAAVTAVKKWKFQPARKNGVAVKVWKSFIIAFKAE